MKIMLRCEHCNIIGHTIYNCTSFTAHSITEESVKKAKESLLDTNRETDYVNWLECRSREQLIILTNHKVPLYRSGVPMSCMIGYCVLYYYYKLAYTSVGRSELDAMFSVVYWKNRAGGISEENAYINAELFMKRQCDFTTFKEPIITEYKYIPYQHKTVTEECPICYEPIHKKQMVEYNCGHFTCEKCLKSMMTMISKTHKTADHIQQCPCCRKQVYEWIVYEEFLKNRLRILGRYNERNHS